MVDRRRREVRRGRHVHVQAGRGHAPREPVPHGVQLHAALRSGHRSNCVGKIDSGKTILPLPPPYGPQTVAFALTDYLSKHIN